MVCTSHPATTRLGSGRPPLPHWLAYRAFGKRVPYPYRHWVRQDVLGRWYLTRQYASSLLILAAFQSIVIGGMTVVLSAVDGRLAYYGPPIWLPMLYAAFVIVIAAVDRCFPRAANRARRHILGKHGFNSAGEPVGRVAEMAGR